MLLQIGLIKKSDLAKWFGITPSSFSHNKTKKMEELKIFADYHLEGDKIYIDKVLIPIYSKQGSRIYQKIKEEVPKTWNKSGLDTCKNVSYKIYQKKIKNKESITENTTYVYVIRARNELFGKPLQGHGSLGECRYILCKKLDDGECAFFTEEEETIKKKLLKKYFSTTDEMTVIVNNMVKNKEIKKEEAWLVYEEMVDMQNNYPAFLAEFSEAIECQVIRGTIIEYVQYFDEIEVTIEVQEE